MQLIRVANTPTEFPTQAGHLDNSTIVAMSDSIASGGSPPHLDSSFGDDGRFLALQQAQIQLEERMSARLQRFEALLINLTNQPAPAVSSNPNIDTAATPQRFDRRNSLDTRTSLNEARNFTQQTATKPKTASDSKVNSPSNVKAEFGRDKLFPSMTIQHPERFKLQSQISKITLQQIRNLENEIEVYLKKPQNSNQQIYLFTEEFMTAAARNYLINQIHERNITLKVPASHEWQTFDHIIIINYMKSILQPRSSKEAEIKIAAIVKETLQEPANKINSYSWHTISSWANKIFRAFEAAEYFLKHIYGEDQEHSASMAPNKSLDLEGLSTLIPNIIFPKLIAIQFNRMFVRERFLKPTEKGFKTLQEYMNSIRIILQDLIKSYSQDEQLIRAIHQEENKAKASTQISALCDRNGSFLNSMQAYQVGSTLLNMEQLDNEDLTDLLSELSIKTNELDLSDDAQLASLAEENMDIDNLVCFRSINGSKCIEKNCKFSHKLEDIALYHRVKGKQVEAKLREAKQNVFNLESKLMHLSNSNTNLNHSVPNTTANADRNTTTEL